jgi:hypothetical protein
MQTRFLIWNSRRLIWFIFLTLSALRVAAIVSTFSLTFSIGFDEAVQGDQKLTKLLPDSPEISPRIWNAYVYEYNTPVGPLRLHWQFTLSRLSL